MRYHEIIMEARAHLEMYQGLPIQGFPTREKEIKTTIAKFEKDFSKKDRVTWLCRWHRIWYASHLELERVVIDEKVWRKFLSAVGSNIQKKEAADIADDVILNLTKFKHYIDLPIPEIQNVIWEKQQPDELLYEFAALEKEWRNNLSDERVVAVAKTDEKIIDFHDGWAWWNLNKSGCRIEGNAMGHCGNGAGSYNETLLSLRKEFSPGYVSPHLTFILRDDGSLGEMKGRNNEKPTAKYHSMIKALLLSDYVTEINGGGYLPENNFKLEDLPISDQEEIKKEKPSLRPAWELYRLYTSGMLDDNDIEQMKNKIEKEVDRFGGALNIDYENEIILIEEKKLDHYVRYSYSLVTKIHDFFLNLDDLIDNVEDDVDYDAIAKSAENKYYYNMIKELMPYESDRYLLPISLSVKDQTVQFTIGLSAFIYLDDDEIGSASRFLDENDYYDSDPDDLLNSYLNLSHVETQILEYVNINTPTSLDNRHIVNVIIEDYEGKKPSDTPHEDQLSFDF